jgi:hypothetical protein
MTGDYDKIPAGDTGQIKPNLQRLDLAQVFVYEKVMVIFQPGASGKIKPIESFGKLRASFEEFEEELFFR